MSESDQLDFWTKLLRLDGFRVAHIRKDTPTDPVRLTLIPRTPLGLCPHCHRACDAIHRRWRGVLGGSVAHAPSAAGACGALVDAGDPEDGTRPGGISCQSAT